MDEDLPRPRHDASSLLADASSLLAKESLDSLSQHELNLRIALLEDEISRVKAHRDRARAHRAAADALFGPRPGQ